jgi:hypothetical protein
MAIPRWRTFRYVTVGKLVEELRNEGVPITRVSFYRLEKRLPFPTTKKSSGGWRRYNRRTADIIKNLIKEDYGVEVSYDKTNAQFSA